MSSIYEHKRMQGFSGIELLIVVAVIAILAAGAYAVSSNLFDSADATSVVQEIGYVDSAINRVYGSTANYAGLEVSVIENSVPTSIQAASGLVHSFGGDITVTDSGNGYEITFAEIPDEPCVELLGAIVNSFEAVEVDGNTIETPADAAEHCGGDLVMTSR